MIPAPGTDEAGRHGEEAQMSGPTCPGCYGQDWQFVDHTEIHERTVGRLEGRRERGPVAQPRTQVPGGGLELSESLARRRYFRRS